MIFLKPPSVVLRTPESSRFWIVLVVVEEEEEEEEESLKAGRVVLLFLKTYQGYYWYFQNPCHCSKWHFRKEDPIYTEMVELQKQEEEEEVVRDAMVRTLIWMQGKIMKNVSYIYFLRVWWKQTLTRFLSFLYLFSEDLAQGRSPMLWRLQISYLQRFEACWR